MRLKYALTIGDPKCGQITAYQAASTGASHLTKTDIMTALGMTQSRHRAGLMLLYAKYTKDAEAGRIALIELTKYAQKMAPKYVGKLTGRKGGIAVRTLAMLALEQYCRTADTPGAKCRCGGGGEVCDRKKTERTGNLVMIPCSKCHGTGLRPVPESRAHHALIPLVDKLSQSTWWRHWRPYYAELISWCDKEESAAETEYNRITNLSNAVAN